MKFREHADFRVPGIFDCTMFSLVRQLAGANGLTDSIGNFFVLHVSRAVIKSMVKTIIGKQFVCLLQVSIPDHDRSTFI